LLAGAGSEASGLEDLAFADLVSLIWVFPNQRTIFTLAVL
jgi:hypothetical protein